MSEMWEEALAAVSMVFQQSPMLAILLPSSLPPPFVHPAVNITRVSNVMAMVLFPEGTFEFSS